MILKIGDGRVPVDKLTDLLPHKKAGVHGHLLQRRPDLRALYRVGSELSPEEVDDFLRKFLTEKLHLQGEELDQQMRELMEELPRLRRGSEGLFAANVRPPVLTRQRISEIAERFLAKYGLTKSTYIPPTPIERLVELEPDIRLRIGPLDRSRTERPYVLGLSRWGADGNKEIVLNAQLVESEDETSEYRLLFTLGHELFHALHHLPLMNGASRMRAECCRVVITAPATGNERKTAAQKAVESWQQKASQPRRLCTPEDWREWQSQAFSAAVLMPHFSIKKEFVDRTGMAAMKSSENINPQKLAFTVATDKIFGSRIFEKSLNQLFKVSAQAMAIRLLELKLVF